MGLLLDNGYDNLGKVVCKQRRSLSHSLKLHRGTTQVSRRGPGVNAVVQVDRALGGQGRMRTLDLWNRIKPMLVFY